MDIQFADIWWVFLLASGLSLILTGIFRRYAIGSGLLDIPNERSSHITPTPSGGGVVCMAVFFVVLSVFLYLDMLSKSFTFAILGAGGGVFLIGLVDDYVSMPLLWRLLVHILGAIWAVFWLHGLPPLPVFGQMVDFSWFGYILCVVYLVWMLNLFNFMDGIDGIAGIETITVCVGGMALYGVSQIDNSEWMALAALLSVIVGFLFWNFPKARIFLGDVGSGSVGMVLGVMSVRAAWLAPGLFWGWVIMLGVFVVDATVTLVYRIKLGEKFYIAHRSHAYQYAARKYGSHPPVSIAVGAINLFWLLPVAVLVTTGVLDGSAGVIIAYTPLVWLALYFKAGSGNRQEA